MTSAIGRSVVSRTLEQAVAALDAGGLAVIPTESFYGLGADALSERAVEQLVAVRGRGPDKPILVLVADVDMARSVARDVPPRARRLAERFWPGPLTLVLPARTGLPDALTAGQETIGVRVSGHAVAREIVRRLGRPITAPSANPPGQPPPRLIAEARAYFGTRVTCYVDAGSLPGGASTVAVVEAGRVRVVRRGPISEQALMEASKDE